MKRIFLRLTAIAVVPSWLCASAQQKKPVQGSAPNPTRIEVYKLLRSFEGSWNVFESFRRGEFFPKGGNRRGTAKITAGPGRLSLVEDYHSNGSAGELDLLAVIWWDSAAQVYRPLICANGGDGCVARGTARWQGNRLINDYDEVIGGRKRKMRDTFSDITPNSFTLVAAVFTEGSEWQPLITTKYRRQ
jgi:hypothetical protein